MRCVRTRSLLAAALAGVLVALALAVARPALSLETSAAAAPVRIMPLGDSITGSPGCWRSLLWNRLQSTGHTDIDFVGTLPPQGCAQAHDGNNEGHGGALVTTVADQNQLVGWLSATRPDIVLMHFGTNDVWSARSTDTILAAYSKLVDQMRASNAGMRILVAKIIPMDSARSCSECAQRVINLNNAIPGWAAGKTTSASPITVVDQWTGFSTASDTYDGVHPNSAGDQKMSDRWYPALVSALGSAPPTTTPPVTTPPVTTPPVTTGPGGCTATYRIAGQWQGNFQGEVTVRNGGASTTQSWTVRFTFANGQQLTQIWNGVRSQSGANVTVTNVSYNGAIPAGGTTTFGFLATWTGTNTAPTPTCTVT
ncbi:cellulose binding domain-containing protein [Phytohabitans aurantiacus]|uniref:SGNH hydrolase n=1 Tax=Phytohabitans aurantiacus TaxID=3016789 RepID=A0ABQ5QSB9_9ACTN|nr:cellulose binding domain-containing protein [Phytohabitans aurantiacus]GLH97511.1 SGNH hydrolase [Phytohabitans aurantiacus]